MLQNPFKPSFPNLVFQILKVGIQIGGFTNVRFFKINGIKDYEKVRLASLHLEGRTLEWFQEYEASNKKINWGQFSIDVVSRFSPSAYEIKGVDD